MTFIKAITLAATSFAIALSATGPSSALSIELAPGVELKQHCEDKAVFVTKIVHVQQGDYVVAVPKKVKVTKTVCTDYYTKVATSGPSDYPAPLAYPEFHPDYPAENGGHHAGAGCFSSAYN